MEKKCKYCKEEIEYGATICHHCQSKQTFWGKFPKSLEFTSLVISIVLMILSFIQYNDTKKEKKDSAKALEIATNNMQKTKEALDISTELKTKSEIIYNKTDSISKQIKKISLLALRNELLIANNSFLALNASSPTARQLEQNMDSLLLLILGNKDSVSRWVKENIKN